MQLHLKQLFLHFVYFSWLLMLTGGCSVGPKYTPPCVDVPQTWKSRQNESGSFVYKDYWWEIFNDERLDALEKQSLENNYDLSIALNRILEAKALMNVAKADLYPHLYLNPFYNNEGVLYESYSDGTVVRSHQVLYKLPLDLSYEVDLWGKIRDQYQSARYHWEAEIEAYNSVYLRLTTDLATVYYQLRTLDAQIDLLQATIKTREKAFEINQSRYKFQIIDYSDVSRAGLELSNTFPIYHEAVRQRAALENRLAVLIGVLSSEFCFEHHPLEGVPPRIPAGIPSEVLMRRPDIAEAERTIASEQALVKSAYASFFPSLELTAGLGFQSPHLKYFLKNFGRLWDFGANSSQVVFDAGKLSANLAKQEARFQEATDSYKQKVLICFQEVEDALSNLENDERKFDDFQTSVEWSQKTNQILNAKYRQGLIFYLDVVISERDILSNEISLNDLKGLRFVSTISLIKALGGGWNNSQDIRLNNVDE